MTDQQLFDKLSEFITENKRDLFDRIAPLRTRHVTVVLEDIHQSQNASAVIRTCDLVGVQDVHVIENRNRYTLNPDVTLGSSKWIDIHRHNAKGADNSRDLIARLRNKGYRIVATSPHGEAPTPETIAIDRPMAICFGTELEGLSDAMLEGADEHLRIPMHGFTESFNISVSAAIVLYTIMQRIRSSEVRWQLHERSLLELKLNWVRSMIHHVERLELRIRDDHAKKNEMDHEH